MKFKNLLKEIFDFNLFKRNMQNAMSTINSEMQNVQANMAEKDKSIKGKDEENEILKRQIKNMSAKLKTPSEQEKPLSPGNKAIPGTVKQIGTRI